VIANCQPFEYVNVVLAVNRIIGLLSSTTVVPVEVETGKKCSATSRIKMGTVKPKRMDINENARRLLPDL
jgi:hypothetical protein